MDNLDPLFNPSSIAVVGASESPHKLGYYPIKNLMDMGFAGEIYPVNPRLSRILGLKAYPSVTAIPAEVDMVVIIVMPHLVPSVLTECAQKGVKGVVVITAGFKETGAETGVKLQEEITSIANKANIKMIGPNTLGIVNPYANLNATFQPTFTNASRGSIAIVSQSGGVYNFLLHSMMSQNLGISLAVGLGNRGNVHFADLVEYLGEHRETRVIALYIEGSDNPHRLMKAARGVVAKKPIVAYKASGDSLNRAAYSHTGSLAGRYEAYKAAFAQSGIVAVDDLTELIDVSKALAFQPSPRGNRVAVLSGQAGPGIIAAHTCQRYGLELAEFSPRAKKELLEIIGIGFFSENPVDLGGAWMRDDIDYKLVCRILEIVLREKGVDAIMASSVYHPLDTPFSDAFISLAKDKKLTKPVVLCCDSPKGAADQIIARLEENGIPVYPFPDRAARALAGLVRYGKARRLK